LKDDSGRLTLVAVKTTEAIMANDKRPRGRPKGDGIDDRTVLMQIAEMIAAHPKMRPTTAFKRLVRRPPQKDIRRIQVKWRAVGAALLAEVRARVIPAPIATAGQGQRLSPFALARRVADSPVLRAMRALDDNPTMRAMRAFQNSPTIKAMQALHDSPVMKAARLLEQSPMMKAARALEDSGIGRMARLIDNDPTLKMMIELERSSAMRAAREHAETMRRIGL